MRTRFAPLFVAAALAGPLAAVQEEAREWRGSARLEHRGDANVVRGSFAAMGTDVAIAIQTDAESAAQAAIALARAEFARIETLMTDWQDTSEVAAINRAAGGAAIEVSPELADLLRGAKRVAQLTRGKFDPTYAGAGRLWDFRADPPRLPDPEQIRRGIERIDFEQLEVAEAAPRVRLARAGMRIGLGGIAKGYAVDRAVQLIEDQGFSNFAVNAGGDLAVRGTKDERLWWVSIRHPREPGEVVGVLPVSNLSVVTSGDYERYFELEGKRYCHIIDPDTGYPASACQSVTIMARRTWWADALATGVFILGPTEGMRLIESLDGVEGMIIASDGAMTLSDGLAGR